MGLTFYNCDEGIQINVKGGTIVEEEQSERIDCKGMKVVPLKCTIALKPSKSLDELLEDPAPDEEFLSSLALGGVGLALVPSGKSKIIETREVPFILDPLLPPEEIPHGKAIVQRAVNPESSFGYKEKYGEWPIKHMEDKIKDKIILNPFWSTTWEVKLIEIPAFVPHLGPLWGVSSPIPPELLEAIYSPALPGEGPEEASKFAELLAKSHYWNKDLQAVHLDEACWRFADEEPPRLTTGERAKFVVKNKWVRYYINGEVVLFPDDIDELAIDISKISLFP